MVSASNGVEHRETSERFRGALVSGDLEQLRRCPKADLHNHGVMGGDPSSVQPDDGFPRGPLQHKLSSMPAMHAWVGERYGKTMPSRQGRLRLIAATFAQARNDGVTRLETGDDVWAKTLFNGSAEKLTEELRQIHADTAPEVDWLPEIGISRHCVINDIERWMQPFLELDFYRSIDLSGDEHAQPIGCFKPVFHAAKQAGLKLKAHVGEWGDADSVWRAVEELELDDVQHGIAAADSPAVMRFLSEKRIRLNICPTSNLMLGRVESLATHPIRKLFDAGVRVTVNTDDVLVFGQGVSAEFLNLYRAGCLNEVELDQVRQTGLADD